MSPTISKSPGTAMLHWIVVPCHLCAMVVSPADIADCIQRVISSIGVDAFNYTHQFTVNYYADRRCLAYWLTEMTIDLWQQLWNEPQ
jgi:hypothetical protein